MSRDVGAYALSGPDGDPPPGPSVSSDAAPANFRQGAAGVSAKTPAPVESVPPAEAALPVELAEVGRTLFGDALPLAAKYAQLLATDGVIRGLLGPRETPRIWERHLLNCAAVAELIPTGARVVDVGSGAGLPGIVLAIARPDLAVVLIEPLARRSAFLTEVVARLGLDGSVQVIRARAEECAGRVDDDFPLADVVTARAVAPLDRLAGWCLPLAAVGGQLLALKGATAADEVAEHGEAVERLGGAPAVVRRCGIGLLEPPTTVVQIVRDRVVALPKVKGSRRSGPTSQGKRRRR